MGVLDESLRDNPLLRLLHAIRGKSAFNRQNSASVFCCIFITHRVVQIFVTSPLSVEGWWHETFTVTSRGHFEKLFVEISLNSETSELLAYWLLAISDGYRNGMHVKHTN